MKAFTYYIQKDGVRKYVSPDHALDHAYYGGPVWVTPFIDPDPAERPADQATLEQLVAVVHGRTQHRRWPAVTPVLMRRLAGPGDAELYADVLDAAADFAERLTGVLRRADAEAAIARRPAVAA